MAGIGVITVVRVLRDVLQPPVSRQSGGQLMGLPVA